MNYKSLVLVVMFALFLGVNTSKAQCECIDEISAAVDAVMLTTGCDEVTEWQAPHALEVHLKKLQNWCGDQVKPLKSKVPNIVEGMLETINEAIEGEGYTDPLTGDWIWTEMPAPECAVVELIALEELLLSCSVQE